MTFLNKFELICDEFKSKDAFRFQNQSISYSNLYLKASRTAGGIKKLNLSEGTLIFIFMDQSIDAIIVFLGCILAGMTPALMPLPSSKQDPKKYWESHSSLIDIEKATHAITNEKYAPIIQDALKINALNFSELINSAETFTTSKDPSLPLFVQHSSGTTGLKKGVEITYDQLGLQIAEYAKNIDFSPADIIVSWLPIYHDMGLIACTMLPILTGSTVVMIDPFKWVRNPSSLFAEIEKNRGTFVWMPNFAFNLMVEVVDTNKSSYDLSTVRKIINCSEFCRQTTFIKFYERFSNFKLSNNALQTCYAMAETVFAVAQSKFINSKNLPLNDHDCLSSGEILDGVKIKIKNEEGVALKDNEVGQIVITAPFLFSGYLNQVEINKLKLVNGEYYSGDLGFIKNNELYVLGRSDDVIVTHGKKIIAHAIENHLSSFDEIKSGRVLAFGENNKRLGTNSISLIIETSKILNEEEIKILKEKINSAVSKEFDLSFFNIYIVANGWLIKSSSGKISRTNSYQKYLKELSGK